MYKFRTQVAADGFAYVSVWWTLFSLFGVFDFNDAHRHLVPLDPNAIPDLVIWGLHLLFVTCACLCYRYERPRQTLGIHDVELIKAFAHIAVVVFLANLPLFAWWHGGSLTLHLLIHAGLIGIGIAALAVVRRLKRKRTQTMSQGYADASRQSLPS